MCLSISEMEVHGSVGEGVALSVRVVVREWRVVHLGVTVLRHELDSILPPVKLWKDSTLK